MPRIEPDPILIATLPDVRPLASILRSVSFRNQATLKISAQGLVVTVEQGHSLQAHAYVARQAFSTYNFHLAPDNPAAYVDAAPASSSTTTASASSPASPPPPDPQDPYCQVSVSLATLLECLDIFGKAGGASGYPFKRDGQGEAEDSLGQRKDESGGGGRAVSWRRRRRGSDEAEQGPRGARRGGGGPSHHNDDEGVTTSLRLSFAGQGEPLVLLLEESGIVTRCEITTFEPEGLLDLAFADSAKVQRMIIKSDGLRDALAELPPSSEKLTLSFSPPTPRSERNTHTSAYARHRSRGETAVADAHDDDEEDEEEDSVPVFRIESVGTLGSTEMDYTDDRNLLETFECDFPIRNTYKFSHIQLTKHALASAIKVSIRTDQDGLLSLQFMIPLSDRGARVSLAQGQIGFVEFLCVPLDEV